MKHRQRLGYTLIGMMMAFIISASVPVIGASTTKTVTAYYNNIKVVVNGQQASLRDAAGNPVEPFVVDGTTYLPVRAVADALGTSVFWDGPTYTVYLGRMDGKLDAPTLRLGDAVNIGNMQIGKTNQITDNYGNRYSEAYNHGVFWAETTFETLLNMKYTRFKGTVYVPEGKIFDGSTYFTIEVDGRTVYTSPDITKTSAPIHLDINITGGNVFKINFKHDHIAFGDCGFYQ